MTKQPDYIFLLRTISRYSTPGDETNKKQRGKKMASLRLQELCDMFTGTLLC